METWVLGCDLGAKIPAHVKEAILSAGEVIELNKTPLNFHWMLGLIFIPDIVQKRDDQHNRFQG